MKMRGNEILFVLKHFLKRYKLKAATRAVDVIRIDPSPIMEGPWNYMNSRRCVLFSEFYIVTLHNAYGLDFQSLQSGGAIWGFHL